MNLAPEGPTLRRPLAGGRALFETIRGRDAPPWLGEFGARTWAQFFGYGAGVTKVFQCIPLGNTAAS